MSSRCSAGYFGLNSYITQRFIRACEALGIPSVPDLNTSKGTLGVTKVTMFHSPPPIMTQLPFYSQVSSSDLHLLAGRLTLTIVTYMDSNGRRVTAENSYLTPEVLRRPDLKVITSATVTKVIFDKTGDRPRAVGVELATSRDGPRFKAKARKEVIVW